MSQDIVINEKQADTLKTVIAAGKMNYQDPNLDRRTLRALEKRGLVKFSAVKTGTVVAPTAMGKKFS